MRDFEIEMFAKALKYAQDEFYLDAINELKALVENYPNSELVDDALFNVGLCYFNLGHYEKAIQEFENLITNFPDATISVLEGGDEYGRTAAKAIYAIINCYLATGNIEKALQKLEELKSDSNSYLIINNQKTTFFNLADNLIQTITKQNL